MKEIERKFLVDPKCQEFKTVEGIRIVQGYIPGSMTTRVRIYGDAAYLTLKGPKSGASCDEFEYPIPMEDAIELDKYCETKISKTRYKVPFGKLVIEVDVFDGHNSGLVIAEVELPTEDTKFEIPYWFGKEVTEDHNYSNFRLAIRKLD